MGLVIETKKLTKKYPGKVALDELDLQVNEGEILGFAWP